MGENTAHTIYTIYYISSRQYDSEHHTNIKRKFIVKFLLVLQSLQSEDPEFLGDVRSSRKKLKKSKTFCVSSPPHPSIVK